MVIGFYILVQQVETNFIVPRILGGAVKLHPLVIMGGVVISASVAGIVGALLAAPVIASGKEIMSYLYAKILSQEPFPPTQAALFFVQHQFEDTYWAKEGEWDYTLWSSIKTIFLSLWYEEQGRLVSFRQLKSIQPLIKRP